MAVAAAAVAATPATIAARRVGIAMVRCYLYNQDAATAVASSVAAIVVV